MIFLLNALYKGPVPPRADHLRGSQAAHILKVEKSEIIIATAEWNISEKDRGATVKPRRTGRYESVSGQRQVL